MAAKCKVCLKSVYPMDPQINLDGTKLHKACAKCGDCGCQITISNFTKNESEDQTVLLCKIHYFKRFHEGGSYLGGDKFRVKSTRDLKLPGTLPSGAREGSPSPNEESEEAHTSVQALKTVFNATKIDAPAPAAPVVVPAKKAQEESVAATPVVVAEEAPVVVKETETVPTEDTEASEETVIAESEAESLSPVAEEEVTAAEEATEIAEVTQE